MSKISKPTGIKTRLVVRGARELEADSQKTGLLFGIMKML